METKFVIIAGNVSHGRLSRSSVRHSILPVIFSCLAIIVTGFSAAADEKKFGVPVKWGYLADWSVQQAGNTDFPGNALTRYRIVAITGFYLGQDGSITTRIRNIRELLLLAQSRGCALVPVISFQSAKEGRSLFSSEKAGKKAIESTVKLARGHGFVHVHFDLEYLPHSYALPLSQFMNSLKGTLEKNGILLSMAVFPQVEFPFELAGLHDFSIMHACCHEVVLMCYDLHRADTPPGPVTDVAWAEKNIRHALQFFSPGRVWLGVPAYGYDYPEKGRARVVSSAFAVKHAVKYYPIRHYSGTLRYQYTDKSGEHVVFVSDSETRARLEVLAGQYGLKGVAVWRIGLEDR